ncbi:hypothetical protein BDV93DRAFT_522087 [Ceratobasidium sp. AG-I]|nr:hypothetical protein BDV93DRAFT_522087 [Ceratobasidium sp. AG-I]
MSSSEPSLEREVEFWTSYRSVKGGTIKRLILHVRLLRFWRFWFVGAAIFRAVESW